MTKQALEEEKLAVVMEGVQEKEMVEQVLEGLVPGDAFSQAHDALRRSRERVRGLQRTVANLTIQVATQDERLQACDKEICTL